MTWNGKPVNPDVPAVTGVDHMRDTLSLVSNSLYNAATYIAHNGNEELAESHAKDAITGWNQLKQLGSSEQYAEAYPRGIRDEKSAAAKVRIATPVGLAGLEAIFRAAESLKGNADVVKVVAACRAEIEKLRVK